ncbi:MAG: autotransporter domain-containing protein [Deltaproteobacteria bacterium]|jgi:uncharacterized protein with beta-barrel porin domain|nr:autotransporter domain-containing protein [Deltaproteobacteria bacterium]
MKSVVRNRKASIRNFWGDIVLIACVFLAIPLIALSWSAVAAAQSAPSPQPSTAFNPGYNPSSPPAATGAFDASTSVWDFGTGTANTYYDDNVGTPVATGNILELTSALNGNYNFLGGRSLTVGTSVTSNLIWVSSGDFGYGNLGDAYPGTANGAIIGGASEVATVTGNTVVMAAGMARGAVIGGRTSNSSIAPATALVSQNKVVIFDGSVNAVFGGMSDTDLCVTEGISCGGIAQSNQVWINGGTIGGPVTGGSSTQGNVTSNAIYIHGGDFAGTDMIRGGYASGATSVGGPLSGLQVNSNRVEIKGDAVTTLSNMSDRSVFGGYLERGNGTSAVSSNTIQAYYVKVEEVIGAYLGVSDSTGINVANMASNNVTVYGSDTSAHGAEFAVAGYIAGSGNGAVSDRYSYGNLQSNVLTVWGATITGVAAGASAEGNVNSTTVTGNQLRIGGGSVVGYAYGGRHEDGYVSPAGSGGAVTNNIIYFDGATVNNDAIAGQAMAGVASGNSITFRMNSTNVVTGDLYAAKIGGSATLGTGNAITFTNGDNTVKGNIGGANTLTISGGVNRLGDNATADTISVGAFNIGYGTSQNTIAAAVTATAGFTVSGGATNDFLGAVNATGGTFQITGSATNQFLGAVNSSVAMTIGGGTNTFSENVSVTTMAALTISGGVNNFAAGKTLLASAMFASVTISGGTSKFYGDIVVNGMYTPFVISGTADVYFANTSVLDISGNSYGLQLNQATNPVNFDGTVNISSAGGGIAFGAGSVTNFGGQFNYASTLALNVNNGANSFIGDFNVTSSAAVNFSAGENSVGGNFSATNSMVTVAGTGSPVLTLNTDLGTPVLSANSIRIGDAANPGGLELNGANNSASVVATSGIAVSSKGFINVGEKTLTVDGDLEIDPAAKITLDKAPGATQYGRLVMATGSDIVASAPVYLDLSANYVANDLIVDFNGGHLTGGGDLRAKWHQLLWDSSGDLRVLAYGGPALAVDRLAGDHSFRMTRNYRAASALMNALDASDPTLSRRDQMEVALDLIDSLGPGKAEDAFKQLIGEPAVYVASAVNDIALKTLGVVYNRLDKIRSGETITPPSAGEGDIGRNRVWAGGFGNWAKQKDADGIYGFSFKSGGAAIGYDRMVERVAGLVVGGSFSYSVGNLDSNDTLTDVDIKTVGIGIYGSYTLPSKYFFDVSFAYAVSDNESTVALLAGGIKDGSFLINSYQLGARGGLMIEKGAYLLTPTVGLRYHRFQMEEWRETVSRGAFPGNVFGATSDSVLEIPLELKIATTKNADNPVSGEAIITPELRLGWTLVAKTHDNVVNAGFTWGPGKTQIFGAKPRRNYFHGGLGFKIQAPNNIDLFINYDFNLGSKYIDHKASLGLGIQFK